MKTKFFKHVVIILMLGFLFFSCEKLVEVAPPSNKLIQKVVFESDATAQSAMTGIYNQLFITAFSNGFSSSITFLSGLSADNLRNIRTTSLNRMEFEQNELLPDNPDNLYVWSSAYNVIYMTNSFLEGLAGSEEITSSLKNQLEGEARFIRAFTFFYLVNLYGDVPLILDTNYEDNQIASRNSTSEVYEQIINDLQIAIDLLSTEYLNGERTQVNQYAATALIARVYLYMENWTAAENYSSKVINEGSIYKLLGDLNEVFLANSNEAIWQISPIGGGGIVTHTKEGSLFIIDPIASFFASIQLRDDFVDTFQEDDKRLSNWTGYNSGMEAYYSYKYKIWNSNEFPIEEYSMVLRFAEQFLIRAEARANQGNLSGAIADLDVIRNRAGLESIFELNPNITQEELLELIIEERRKELFAEWGHRWLDLKRTGRASAVLGEGNPFWKDTDVLYPIPGEERRKSPNLSQNDGY